MKSERPFSNPYLAGIGLGLVLLSSFVFAGKGLGASGAAYRIGLEFIHWVSPARTEAVPYFAHTLESGEPLRDFYVVLIVGLLLGALVSAYAAGRLGRRIIRGPRIGVGPRLALAVSGGVIMGFAARLTLGCTSGQALSGGSLMSAGSWVFMMCVFAGGYAAARFVKRQWT